VNAMRQGARTLGHTRLASTHLVAGVNSLMP
jgi:hypothetical protein